VIAPADDVPSGQNGCANARVRSHLKAIVEGLLPQLCEERLSEIELEGVG
jgi:hypothetical protein